jgi:hypothetical protein
MCLKMSGIREALQNETRNGSPPKTPLEAINRPLREHVGSQQRHLVGKVELKNCFDANAYDFFISIMSKVTLLLFDQIVKMDLERIVCKRKDSPYKVTEKPSRYWIKVKNSLYSQLARRT